MIRRIRHRFGIGRRSRRFAFVAGWLCFVVAALPCAAATPSACGSAGSDVAPAHSGHHGDAMGNHHASHADRGDAAGADCPRHAGGDCCDAQPPTLEDRSPKIPGKLSDAGVLPAPELRWALLRAPRAAYCATGPPPQAADGPRRHTLFCTFLD